MTEQLLAWLAAYGLPVIGLGVGLGCLGVPMPSSLLILVGASLAAAGEFYLPSLLAVCLISAILGDQIGFFIGSFARGSVPSATSSNSVRAKLFARGKTYLEERGTGAVFFSRWFTSPLGPPINFIAGAVEMPWKKFTIAGIAGEIVWVALYSTLGTVFGNFIPQIEDVASSITALIAALAVMVVLGRYLMKIRKR